jgi:hypothetical protein
MELIMDGKEWMEDHKLLNNEKNSLKMLKQLFGMVQLELLNSINLVNLVLLFYKI